MCVSLYFPRLCPGYNLQAGSFNTPEQKTLFFHRLIETWKFAFGRRPQLRDVTFDKDKKVIFYVAEHNQMFAFSNVYVLVKLENKYKWNIAT